MRSKIAVVGEKESVLGFKAVGFEVFETAAPKEAEEAIHRLAKQEYYRAGFGAYCPGDGRL